MQIHIIHKNMACCKYVSAHAFLKLNSQEMQIYLTNMAFGQSEPTCFFLNLFYESRFAHFTRYRFLSTFVISMLKCQKNADLHISHEYGFSFVCALLLNTKNPEEYGFSPVPVLVHKFNSKILTKVCPHNSKEYGFSIAQWHVFLLHKGGQ